MVNVTANPAIRFFLICGKDSPVFHPGQSLVALAERGLDAERQIVGAIGYQPVLSTLAPERVAQFRRQVAVIDWTGEEDLQRLAQGVGGLLARNPGHFAPGEELVGMSSSAEQFVSIRPGGVREPLQYDPKGYFVITLDREEEQITLRHYLPNHSPAHEMRGRVAGSMLLGLLREGLVTQLNHAGYLGEELAKAEAALRLDLRYDQDRPLRPRDTPRDAPLASMEGTPAQETSERPSTTTPTAMPPVLEIPPALTLAQLQRSASGATVDVVVVVTDLPGPDLLGGSLLEADEAEPFSAFRRTQQRLQIRWSPATQIVMGEAADVAVGALVRARGVLAEGFEVQAQTFVILTRVARILA